MKRRKHMKKLIAILCAVAVLATSLFGALVFTAVAEETVTPVAEGDVLEDTVIMPTYLDEFGNELNIFTTNETIPSSVINFPGVSTVKNTAVLPFTALFKITAGTDLNYHTELRVKAAAGKGALIYVEMPESADGKEVRFSTQFKIRDGQTGRVASRHQYADKKWYFLGENDTAWTSKTISYYGIPLASGFKGYVYIPLSTVTGGATDLPDTPENEAAPQKRNSSTGAYIYTDNLTKAETESATDANGNPNKAKIEAQPSSGNPYYVNAGIDAEDELVGIVIMTGKNYMAKNGNMDPSDEVIVSAPVVVKGDVTDTTLPDTRKVVADGKEEYLFKSYVPYTGSETYTALRTPNGTKTTKTWGDIVMTKIPAISPLVSGAYEFTNLSAQTRTFQSEASVKDTGAAIGVMFYVETTLENFEVNINSLFYDSTGTNKYPSTSHTSGDLYYIKEGDTKWTATGTRDGSGASANYRRKLKTTGTFKGYIYQPISGNASTIVSMTEGYFKYAGITLWPTTADDSWTDASGNAATLKISDPIVVTALNTTTNKVVLDGGALVDPFTGPKTKGYLDADSFVGSVEDIDLVGDIMSLKPMADPTRNAAHVLSATKGTFNAKTNNGYTGTIVENDTIFGDDLVRVVGSDTATQNHVDMLEMNYTQTSTADVDGYMMYIRNDSDTTLRLAFQPYTVKADGNYNYTQVTSTLPFLSQVDGKWQWSEKKNIDSAFEVAPGEGGYFYFSNATLFNGASYKYGKIRTADKNTTPTTNVNFVASAPIAVNNYTQNAAGMAYVNGADVPQDLYSGEFTVPNDYDGNLSVNLLDLVQSKTEGGDEVAKAFKENYFTNYFNAAEYEPVLSNVFSLRPLKYDSTNASTILSSNPDRGYRSEMVIYFAEKPLTLAEAGSYTPKLLSGTGRVIDVSANNIYDAFIANGTRQPEVETDYDISFAPAGNANHNDRYPLGDGSGGAVHTLTAETIRAWINAHNAKINSEIAAGDTSYPLSEKITKASGETEEDYLVRAARTLVADYMRYEKYQSNMKVSELTKVVYLTKEQINQIGYTGGAWSDKICTFDGMSKHVRREGFSGTNLFYYENGDGNGGKGYREYNQDGSLKSVKIHVYYDPRTLFASDSSNKAEWTARLDNLFDLYKIGYDNVEKKTYYTTTVKYADGTTTTVPIVNNLFNAYFTFTEYAHKAELSEGALEALDYALEYTAYRGAKANLRPSYNTFTDNAYLDQTRTRYLEYRENVARECANQATMIAHIKQMAPIIAANKNAIHNISSGWIGFGGEMAADFQYPAVSYKDVITTILEEHCIPNGLYFSTRSTSYITNIINGVATNSSYNSGNLDMKGLAADAPWAEKYAKWCGFNNDAFFGEQNFPGWGSGNYYDKGNASYIYDTANAAYTPNNGELYTNGKHVYNLRLENGKYVWVGFDDNEGKNKPQYNDTDNMVPTPIEAIRELAHHRYTDFSQWHGFLGVATPNVMTFWMDHNAKWVFEGDVDSTSNGGYFNASKRAAELTAPITKELLEANGILYDPAWFANGGTRNAYEFIRDHLGYRLVAQTATVNYDATVSDKMNVSVNIKNYGFGAAFCMESSLAILDKNGNVIEEIKAGDPSTWYNLAPDYYTVERKSSAQNDVLTHTVTAGFNLPKKGEYYVAFRIENTAGQTAKLANDIQYINGYAILGEFSVQK